MQITMLAVAGGVFAPSLRTMQVTVDLTPGEQCGRCRGEVKGKGEMMKLRVCVEPAVGTAMADVLWHLAAFDFNSTLFSLACTLPTGINLCHCLWAERLYEQSGSHLLPCFALHA